MLRRRFLAQGLALISLPILEACGARAPLRVGIHPWIGYETLPLARDFGWLPPEVVLTEGKSAVDTLAGLREGRLDAGALTLDEVLSARAAGVPLTVVLVFNVSAGADMLLVRPEIRTLAELAGKRIAVERSAVGALMLVKVLEAAGLEAQAVEVLDLPIDQQLQAWQAGRIDAAISYEPMASRLRRAGAVLLFDSRRLPDTIFDVLAVRRDHLAGRKAALRGLLRGHFRALGHLRINREDAVHRIATRLGVPPEDVRRALGGVVLPDLQGNRQHFSDASHLESAARQLGSLMAARGLLPAPDDLKDLFDARYLPGPDEEVVP